MKRKTPKKVTFFWSLVALNLDLSNLKEDYDRLVEFRAKYPNFEPKNNKGQK